jgi:hypothetical protein
MVAQFIKISCKVCFVFCSKAIAGLGITIFDIMRSQLKPFFKNKENGN